MSCLQAAPSLATAHRQPHHRLLSLARPELARFRHPRLPDLLVLQHTSKPACSICGFKASGIVKAALPAARHRRAGAQGYHISSTHHSLWVALAKRRRSDLRAGTSTWNTLQSRCAGLQHESHTLLPLGGTRSAEAFTPEGRHVHLEHVAEQALQGVAAGGRGGAPLRQRADDRLQQRQAGRLKVLLLRQAQRVVRIQRLGRWIQGTCKHMQ